MLMKNLNIVPSNSNFKKKNWNSNTTMSSLEGLYFCILLREYEGKDDYFKMKQLK